MSEITGIDDGWRQIPNEQQHYFFREYSLCNKYDRLGDSFHDNDPSLHCEKCDQLVGKLFALADTIKTSHVDIKDILKLMESKEVFDATYGGLNVKVKTKEDVHAVVTSSGGKKTVIEDNKSSPIKRIFHH